MGQYYKIINLDKKEYLHPHDFGDGLKLLEFGLSGNGTMAGLAILLANSNGRGGGDLTVDEDDLACSQYIGRWAGDRIVITGDYGNEGELVPPDEVFTIEGEDYKSSEMNLYTYADAKYTNISAEVIYCLMHDSYVRGEYQDDKENYLLNRNGLISELGKLLDTQTEDLPTLMGTLKNPGAQHIWELRMKSKPKKQSK